MAEKVACPKCGEENYATDRQCLSCGTALAATAPPSAHTPAPAAVAMPAHMARGDGRNWWRRCVDDVIEYQLGAVIGLAVVVLGPALAALILVGSAAGFSQGLSSAVALTFFFGLAAFFFIWYTREPDSIWPLVLAILITGLTWWIAIALFAFGGAAIQKRMQRD